MLPVSQRLLSDVCGFNYQVDSFCRRLLVMYAAAVGLFAVWRPAQHC